MASDKTGYPRNIGECDKLEREIRAAFEGDHYNVRVMWRYEKGPDGIHGASFGWKNELTGEAGGDLK